MKPGITQGKLLVQDTLVSFTRIEQSDFISLTDIALVKNPDEPKDVVKNWLRSRSTLDFLGLWEKINNPNFKGVEFDSFKNESGTNSFTLSPSKWIETTGAIGIPRLTTTPAPLRAHRCGCNAVAWNGCTAWPQNHAACGAAIWSPTRCLFGVQPGSDYFKYSWYRLLNKRWRPISLLFHPPFNPTRSLSSC